MMKRLFIGFTMFMLMNVAQAYLITSTSGCPGGVGCDPAVSGDYSYNMAIESSDGITWGFELTNLGADGVIDAFAMDMDATLGTDFTVANFDPASWNFTGTSAGIQFDYIGDSGSPFDRLGVGDALTFDFIFNTAVDETVWSLADASLGTGIGGGTDFGQVAVSFQTLGTGREYSDLVSSNWVTNNSEPDPVGVPEPTPLALMGLGLMGIGWTKHKQRLS